MYAGRGHRLLAQGSPGPPRHAVSQALDRKRLLEEKRQAEQRLFLETFHDSLTGLPNRALFLDRLDRVYQQTRRQSSHLFGLVYLNLDGFLMVHDSLGPAAADRVLIEVSQRLLRRVRSADTVARMEGYEFAFLLDNLKADSNAMRVADRLQQEFAMPFTVEGREIVLTAHMGLMCCNRGMKAANSSCAMPRRPCIRPKPSDGRAS